jgi:hypothetical protein
MLHFHTHDNKVMFVNFKNGVSQVNSEVSHTYYNNNYELKL